VGLEDDNSVWYLRHVLGILDIASGQFQLPDIVVSDHIRATLDNEHVGQL
jgi:hypothetical protein